jgi:hypothetical protein
MKINNSISFKKELKTMKTENNSTIKNMIDEYYRDLETNLKKLGGISEGDVGSMLGSEMTDIGNYALGLSGNCNKKRR